jgi:hypothetical protein
MRPDLEPRRNRYGAIDVAFYKARAERLRQEAMIALIRALPRHVADCGGRLLIGGGMRLRGWMRKLLLREDNPRARSSSPI